MFKSIASLTAVAAVVTAFALPAHAIYVGNGTASNALDPNGTRMNGVELRVEQPRLLSIELPRK